MTTDSPCVGCAAAPSFGPFFGFAKRRPAAAGTGLGETVRCVLRMLCAESDDGVQLPLQLPLGDAESALTGFDGAGPRRRASGLGVGPRASGLGLSWHWHHGARQVHLLTCPR